MKPVLKVSFLLLSLVSLNPCLAAIPLDPAQVLEFKISRSGMTRISVVGDTIEDVYAYPAEPDLVTHHKSGHVFVTPDELTGPLSLTIITRLGIAQDLRLIPQSKKAEAILLKYEEAEPVAAATPEARQELYADLLAKFIKGKVPEGFVSTTSQEVSRGKELNAILDQAWKNTHYRLLVFTLKNETPEPQTLDNRVFWEQGKDLASAFDRPVLQSLETARLFVIQPL